MFGGVDAAKALDSNSNVVAILQFVLINTL